MVTAVYKRASDEKQDVDGVSIETQEETINKFCEYKGYENIKTYVEIKSARTMDGRTQLKQLINDVKQGRINRVIVYKLDRLTRSLRDLMNILHILEKHDCELHSTYENIDTSSPSGRMLVQVLGMIAEWESANTSLRVANSMQYLSSQGIWQSSIPYGFDLGEDKRLVVNETEASILRESFNMLLDGHSLEKVENKMRIKYGVTWGNNFLRRKIRHATVVGDIERNGVVYENTHEGIITKKEQAKLLKLLKSRMTGRRFIENDDLFRRRVKCPACDSTLQLVTRSHNNYKTKHYSYVCGMCRKEGRPFVSVSEKLLEQAFLEYISSAMVVDLDDYQEESNSEKKSEIEKLERELKSLDKKRDRVQRAWINDMMSDDDLDTYQNEIERERNAIIDELEKLNVKSTSISKEDLKEIKLYMHEHFKELTRSEKRKFTQRHIKKIEFERKLKKGYKKKYDIKINNVEFF